MKMFYLCIVNLRDGISAAGRKNYRSGQAGKFTWAGRKMKSERRHENEILCLTKNHYKIMALKVKAVWGEDRSSTKDRSVALQFSASLVK